MRKNNKKQVDVTEFRYIHPNWYRQRDLNPHALRQGILSPLCLPFHHAGVFGRQVRPGGFL